MFKIALLLCFSSSMAFAGVRAFKGDAGETLLIESTNDPKVSYVRVTGVSSDWAGKVLKTRLVSGTFGGESYVIDYKKEHGINKGPKQYYFLTVSGREGATLDKGSIVKTAVVHAPGVARDGVKFTWNPELTDSSQTAGLSASYAKSPFIPDLDKK